MRRAGIVFALAFLVASLALAPAARADSATSSSSAGEEIKQGFVSFGHGVRDGAVTIGHGVRDASVKAWGAVKSSFNGDSSGKDKAPPPRPSSGSDSK